LQIANPSVAALYEDALVYETGSAITSNGALTAFSGAKTGRSPLDKRIVKEPSSEKDVWWGPVNKSMDPQVSAILPLVCCCCSVDKTEGTGERHVLRTEVYNLSVLFYLSPQPPTPQSRASPHFG